MADGPGQDLHGRGHAAIKGKRPAAKDRIPIVPVTESGHQVAGLCRKHSVTPRCGGAEAL